ncbi:MAG: hypothetical protein NVS3B25_19180 [Hymenobacter sp.]
MLSNLRYAFDRKWVAALYNYPNPPRQTLLGAVFTLIGEGGGRVVFVG